MKELELSGAIIKHNSDIPEEDRLLVRMGSLHIKHNPIGQMTLVERDGVSRIELVVYGGVRWLTEKEMQLILPIFNDFRNKVADKQSGA